MFLKKVAALVLMLSFVTAAIGAPPGVSTAKTGMDRERLSLIAPRMKAFVDKGTVPGVVTLIARHGAVASLEAVGYQDLEEKKPMRSDTIFQIMSMTKPVTATGIMMLMEEGRLAIADPVEKYLPEFRNMWVIESSDGNKGRTLKRPSRPITIRDLLTHTSGLSPNGAITLDKDLGLWMPRSLAEIVAMGSQVPLDFDPGTKWQYSNLGIATLGRIIEVVADQPYDKFLENSIFTPLGMKDTYVFPPAEKYDRIAKAYILENGTLKLMGPDTLGGGEWRLRKGARYPLPEGGLFSTATDLLAFYQTMLNGGTWNGKRLLAKSTVDLMTAVHTGDLKAGHQPGMGYGLAWAVVRDPMGSLALPLVSVGSYGHGGAFGTHGWVDPKNDLVGVFLVQRSGADAERNAFMSIANSAVLN